MSHDRRALDAPSGDVVVLDQRGLDEASSYAQKTTRKRVIQPFHKHHDEALHRMFNAVEPGTYVRPHRHLDPPKAEAFVVLRGAADFVLFEDDGSLERVVHLRAGGDAFGIDLAPGRFHGFLVREAGTVLYEVKTGPYQASNDKDFAAWAPVEGSDECEAWLSQLDERVTAWVANR